MHPPHANQAPPLEGYDLTLHLGYRGWPQRPLPFETLDCLNEACSKIAWKPPRDTYWGLRWQRIGDEELHLDEPWITLPSLPPEPPLVSLAVGFTEAWFELKLGLLTCLHPSLWPRYLQLTPPGSRWTIEAGLMPVLAADWVAHACVIREADIFFGDCSALHVLACAVGTPVLLMEPMEGRWNDIFYPFGKTGPQVTLIAGGDGRPTFDARHCRDAIETALSRRRATTT